ncbi:SMP domain-containing protein [Pleurotus pulmonarius]
MPPIFSTRIRATAVLSPLRSRIRYVGCPPNARPFGLGASSDDPLKQTKKAAQEARRHSTNPVDAASPQLKERAYTDASGNKEGVGMVDQVGSQSATANKLRDWPAK